MGSGCIIPVLSHNEAVSLLLCNLYLEATVCVWIFYIDCETFYFLLFNNYVASLEPCYCPDCSYNYYYTNTRAVEPTHLDDLIDEAHMSDGVSLLHQDFLQVLHLEKMQ